MTRQIFGTLITYLIIVSSVNGQSVDRKDFDIDNFIEEIFPAPDEDLPYEEIYESLFQYYQSPLNLNTATKEELSSLYVLSSEQIESLLSYKHEQGALISLYELQVVKGFDLKTIRRLLPFVEIREVYDKTSLKKQLHNSTKYFLLRADRTLEEKKGYSSEKDVYAGSPERILGRFRMSRSKEFSVGFTFEKDAGESLQWNSPNKKYGFDFLSYHAIVENKGNFRKIAFGDYQLQFGQGLVTGAGFSTGKSSEAVKMVRKYNTGIRPYTSSVESGFYRGIAITYTFKSIDLTGYYSNQYVDASVKSDSLDEDFIQSLQITGLHRTETELLSRKEINRQDVGGNITFNPAVENLQLGFTYATTLFNAPIQKKQNKYNQFDFTGSSNFCYALNYSYIYRNFNFFGEVAKSKSKGMGLVSGIMAGLSSKADFTILYRKYDKDFHSFNGNGFGENARNVNEEGLYFGLKLSPIRTVTFNGYFDRYYKEWLSFRSYGPSRGNELFGKIQFQPKKTINFYIQVRNETSEKNSRGPEKQYAKLENEIITKWLANVEFSPIKILKLRSRLQTTSVQQSTYKSKGLAIFQDVTIDFERLKLSGRYCIFETDDYSSRQYAYEKDVLYTFSFPALSGEGVRSYLLLQYHLRRHLRIWMKVSRTSYSNANFVGSGNEEIRGNKKTDLRIQMYYSF